MTRTARLAILGSLGVHATLAALFAGGADAPAPRLVTGVQVEVPREVALEREFEPPVAAAPVPQAREPLAEPGLVEEPAGFEAVDARFAPGAPGPVAGGIGLGSGISFAGPVRIAPRPAAAATAVETAPPVVTPGPTARARPIPGACPAPDYPARARRIGVEGATEVRAQVDAEGGVASAEVAASSGDASLDAAAVDAALRWRFEPALRDGVAVPDEFRVRFLFRLESSVAAREGRP